MQPIVTWSRARILCLPRHRNWPLSAFPRGHNIRTCLNIINWAIFICCYSCLAYPGLSHPQIFSQACKFRPLPEIFTLCIMETWQSWHQTQNCNQSNCKKPAMSGWRDAWGGTITVKWRVPEGQEVTWHVSVLSVIDKYCCYQNQREAKIDQFTPDRSSSGMSKYTGIGRRSQVSNTDMDNWHRYHHIWLDHWLTAHGVFVLTHDTAAADIPRIHRCRSRRCSGCPHTSGWAPGWCSAWRGRGRYWSCCWIRTESSGPRRTSRQLPPVQTRSRMRRWDY